MSNYHMNMEAMRKYQSEKAQLMDEIFGYRINGLNKPTYNLTKHELSDTLTHRFSINDWGYQMERIIIIYSCENNAMTYGSYGDESYYIFVEDLDISVLKAIKYEIGNTSYYDWLKNKKEQEQKKIEAIKVPLRVELEEEKAKRIELENKIAAIQAFLNK